MSQQKVDRPRKPKTQQVAIKHTSHIRITGYGSSETGALYVQLQFPTPNGPRKELLRIDNLSVRTGERFGRLNRLKAHLIDPSAQRELIRRIQAERPRKRVLKVADRVGYTAGTFVLPDTVISPGRSRLAVCLDDLEPRYAAKYRTTGTVEGAKCMMQLARGSSRFILGLALALVGPVGALMRAQPVAIRLCGRPGSGRTTLGCVVSSLWGWSADPNFDTGLGFGETWNITLSKLGAVAAAHCHTFLFLDETKVIYQGKRSPAQALLEAVMLVSSSLSAAKSDGTVPHNWYPTILSTSNPSLDELATRDGVPIDNAYRDRMIDIPNPGNGDCVFETLHKFTDLAKFATHIKDLAQANHGVIAREFVRKLVDWQQRNPKRLSAWLQNRRDFYLKRCQSIVDPHRDLTRVHQKFAIIYVAGRLAIEFGLFPFTWRELLAAILSCERDHVRLVASATAALRHPVAKIQDYVIVNRQSFADVRKGPMPADYDHDTCPGYRSRGEFWLTAECFARIVGTAVVQRAKAELDGLNLLRKTAGGASGARYVAKRPVGTSRDGKPLRHYVVVIDRKILKWRLS
jgi:hypothetical protein